MDAESASGHVSLPAFDSWARPHLVQMHRLALRLVGPSEADDVVQEALSRAWRRWHTYDAEVGSAVGWLLAIVRDKARRRSRPTVLDLAASGTTEFQTAVVANVDLERAIAGLTDRQRLAVEMYYLLDLPVADVAVIMDCSPGTVKATLSQARARLRALVGGDDD